MGVEKRPPPKNAREAKKQGFAWIKLTATASDGARFEITGPFTDEHAALIVWAAMAKNPAAARRAVQKKLKKKTKAKKAKKAKKRKKT